jgi:NADH dehydrogenase (ubiquinone) 1 beta subcomplex subunit 3
MSSVFPQNKWSGPQHHDPWWKAEQWRYEHPLVAPKYLWRKAFPGFGFAALAFGAYVAVDYLLYSPNHHHSDQLANK